MHEEKAVCLCCRDCGAIILEKEFALVCNVCGAPLRVTFSSSFLKQELSKGFSDPDDRSFLHDWLPFLPIANADDISKICLGETETKLLPSLRLGKAHGIEQLYFKLEMGPTLSLKDRGTALCVLKALEFGCDTVCLSSSGNNSASIAAYGARANLRTVVFVQKNVSPAKLAKCMVYGGKLIVVDGDMAVASKLCSEMVRKHGWFQCGGPNPYRLAAKRLMAYGLVRQLGKAPDTVLIPCGGGAGLVSAYDGFLELFEAGIIDRLPRLIGVQLEACNPTALAFEAGKSSVTPIQKKASISDAIMNNNPYWGKYCLQAVRKTGGTFISVSDAEFLEAIRNSARQEGLYLEPAGAVTVAALAKLVSMPNFSNPGVTVCSLTGHGLNFPQATAADHTLPEPIEASEEAVARALAL